MLGSANISGSNAMHMMTGNLSFQIEHHLFPDLPSNRYKEIAPKVKDVFERYGLEYTTGSLPQPGLLGLAQGHPPVAAEQLHGHQRDADPLPGAGGAPRSQPEAIAGCGPGAVAPPRRGAVGRGGRRTRTCECDDRGTSAVSSTISNIRMFGYVPPAPVLRRPPSAARPPRPSYTNMRM